MLSLFSSFLLIYAKQTPPPLPHPLSPSPITLPFPLRPPSTAISQRLPYFTHTLSLYHPQNQIYPSNSQPTPFCFPLFFSLFLISLKQNKTKQNNRRLPPQLPPRSIPRLDHHPPPRARRPRATDPAGLQISNSRSRRNQNFVSAILFGLT